MEAKQLDDGIDRYVRISRRDRRVVVSAGQPADCLHGIGSIALRHSDLTAGASTDHVNLQLFEIHAMPLQPQASRDFEADLRGAGSLVTVAPTQSQGLRIEAS